MLSLEYLNKCKVQHCAGKPICIVCDKQRNVIKMFCFRAVVSSLCSLPENEMSKIPLEIAPFQKGDHKIRIMCTLTYGLETSMFDKFCVGISLRTLMGNGVELDFELNV